MRNFPTTRLTFFKALTILLCACGFNCLSTGPSERASSGGTGSEIVGNAAYDSSAAKKAVVRMAASLIPVVSGNVFCYQRSAVPDTDWVRAGALPRAQTDSNGFFTIHDAPPGEVVVEANDGKGSALATTVMVDKDSSRFSAGILTVKKTGSATIQAQTQLPGRIRFYVGVMGTRLVVRGSQLTTDVKLDNIPCGIAHTICVRVYEPVYYEFNITGISVSPGVVRALGSFQIK